MLLGVWCIGSLYAQARPSAKELEKHQKAVAQSRQNGTAILSLDTVFNAGEPYCRTKVLKCGAMSGVDIRVFDMQGNEGFFIKHDGYDLDRNTKGDSEYYLVFTFVADGQKTELPYISAENKIAALIVSEGLFRGGALNAEAVRSFILHNGTPYSQRRDRGIAQGVGAASSAAPVQRNNHMPVMIFGNEIKQGGVLIGLCNESKVAERGNITAILQFTNPDGALIAEARCVGVGNHSWSVVTYRDNRQHAVAGKIGQDDKLVAEYLVQMLYL